MSFFYCTLNCAYNLRFRIENVGLHKHTRYEVLYAHVPARNGHLILCNISLFSDHLLPWIPEPSTVNNKLKRR